MQVLLVLFFLLCFTLPNLSQQGYSAWNLFSDIPLFHVCLLPWQKLCISPFLRIHVVFCCWFYLRTLNLMLQVFNSRFFLNIQNDPCYKSSFGLNWELRLTQGFCWFTDILWILTLRCFIMLVTYIDIYWKLTSVKSKL